ncbi:MAG: CHASE3 domain-containing protein [Solirubrobacterales bacterium]|nr:CHASE3 domain-containing protein [Solirubrobacterales bacterium]
MSRRSVVGRLRSDQWVALVGGVLLAVALSAVVVSILALDRQADARAELLDRLDPARTAQLQLAATLVDEETGVRGYALAGRPAFLEPYRGGRRTEPEAFARLERRLRGTSIPDGMARVAAVREAMERWHRDYADPVIAAVRRDGPAPAGTPPAASGKALFDAVRARLAALDRAITVRRAAARERLDDAATDTRRALIAAGVLLAFVVLAAALTLRQVLARPLRALAGEVRLVSRGDFRRPIPVTGPRDVVGVGEDVDRLRRRIVRELEALEEAQDRLQEQARDLARSNAELEQFAYVASHDLQEPLRKVASFCQALERRYGDQLDDRARQYIDYAVDGAKRMQVLINDLLAFSRVGRLGQEHELVDCGELVEDAKANLGLALEEAGARVVIEDDLPTLRGDRSLLTLLFQNLIGNAVKFRGDAPPEVRLSAQKRDGEWLFACADNGIGVAPRYADRIFVIFQRLHHKEEYAGTGIGLAMCRKIVEYHGGRIWLEDHDGPGATFRFTLPPAKETDTA